MKVTKRQWQPALRHMWPAPCHVMRQVAILFLAHDGVANPDIWQNWKDFDPVS